LAWVHLQKSWGFKSLSCDSTVAKLDLEAQNRSSEVQEQSVVPIWILVITVLAAALPQQQ
jgi:hypothetical protein